MEVKSKNDDTLEPWAVKVNRILTDPPFTEPVLPCEILPWLFLSSEMACRPTAHRMTGMTHVLTVNAMSPQRSTQLEWEYRSVGIDHYYVGSYDEEGYDMLGKHWTTDCRPVLERVRNEPNSKMVVHCAAGQNRSGVIVAAALVDLEGWSLIEAVRWLKSKRGLVLTNLSFQRQLCELAKELGQLGQLDE